MSAANEARVRAHMAFADAALAVAGHEVTDPFVRGLAERVARHEISGDHAIELLRRYVQDRPDSQM